MRNWFQPGVFKCVVKGERMFILILRVMIPEDDVGLIKFWNLEQYENTCGKMKLNGSLQLCNDTKTITF